MHVAFQRRSYAVILCLIASSGLAQDDVGPVQSGVFLDGIVAIVNDGVVLQSELDAETAMIRQRLTADNVPMPPDQVLVDQVLERLIVNQIQVQRANRMGIRIPDDLLNQTIGQMAAQQGLSINDLPAALATQGVDYATYRNEVRREITLRQLRSIEVTGRIQVSPREIEQCLEKQIGQVNSNAEYDISHILISVPAAATAAQFAEAEKEANDVRDTIVGGANFSEMAVRHSDAQTALEGGALGWRRGDQIPTLFSTVVAELDVGETSEPIRSPSGYHLVQLNDQRGAVLKSEVQQNRVRHILVTTNEVVDDRTAELKLQQARDRIVGGEEFGELAREMSEDPGSGNEGGDMGWAEPGMFVPEFEKVVNESEIGELSQPFKTRFGWHMLEVLDRRIYDNTDEMRQRSCEVNIRNARLDEEIELWLRRLRDDAFVDKRI
ncbi:MAG: peptidylprolyl isomerase [Pseudomonadota bacterium]